jgi:hypothetical protein
LYGTRASIPGCAGELAALSFRPTAVIGFTPKGVTAVASYRDRAGPDAVADDRDRSVKRRPSSPA